ncbi:uncharacterized protein AMSG_03554 [Thecamonas trahens ATCC 50062]|uniref:Fibronectin type-III domain-containing protein n=1 Tax=Thecamonas trahens ATCC 50062 TaxID=461836 RepID=A0A0L0D4G7_THETB|nr:hypothetical protein AMSG_03554 [Thecamonas trahens ATCC 50062]KNC47125.1 hypothetical protein AMSG_03554 [Thecamonas trahens ATCC 50062]|eukprot:XP_013759901.1 hypothetical protein AMSG_03554 [Thecamonas trahens ATCC 50062]
MPGHLWVLLLAAAVACATLASAASYRPPTPGTEAVRPTTFNVTFTLPPAVEDVVFISVNVSKFVAPGVFANFPSKLLAVAELGQPESPVWTVYESVDASADYVVVLVAVFADGSTSEPSEVSFYESPAPEAPDSPTGLASSAVAPDSAELSWDAPYDGGAAITDYNIVLTALDPPDAPSPALFSTTGATTTLVSSLSSYTQYEATVTATSSAGTSPPSPPLVFRTRPAAADPVVDAYVTATSHYTASLEVAIPRSYGTPVVALLFSAEPGAHHQWLNFTESLPQGDVVAATLIGLEPSTNYAIQIQALAEGAELSTPAPPPALTARTADPAAPDSVGCLVDLSVINATAVALTWTAPYDSGAAITSYEVSAVPTVATSAGKPTSTITVAVPGATNSEVVGSLLPATPYELYVVAINPQGTSPPPPCLNATTTLAGPPDPVACGSIVVTPVSDTQLDVAWVAPSDAGSTITNYTVVYTHLDSGGTPDGESMNVVVSASPAALAGLGRYTDVGVTVTATNSVGSSPPSCQVVATTLPGFPEPTVGVAAVDVTRSSARITWSPIDDNGMPLLNTTIYVFEMQAFSAAAPPIEPHLTQPGGGSQAHEALESLAAEVYIGSVAGNGMELALPASTLEHNTQYGVIVLGANAAGQASFVIPPFAFLSGPAEPEKPDRETFVATAVNPRTLSLLWDAPNDSGSPIVQYDVFLTRISDSFVISGSFNTTSGVVTGLEASTEYLVQVLAINAVGSSDLSHPLYWLSPEAVAPSAVDPTSFFSLSSTRSSIHIGWAEPFDGGSPVSDYVVLAYDTVTGAKVYDMAGDASLSRNITGLYVHRDYAFIVAAVNSVGIGAAPVYPPDSTGMAMTATGPPDPVTSIQLYAYPAATSLETSSLLLLEWQGPDDNGFDFTTVEVMVYAMPDESPVAGYPQQANVTASGGSEAPVELDGLMPDSEYGVRLVIYNKVGASPPSDLVVSRTGPGVPNPPDMVNATADGPRGIHISWSPPLYTGGAPIEFYTVHITGTGNHDDTFTIAGEVTTLDVSSLCMAGDYEVEVIAANAVANSAPSPAVAVSTPGEPPSVVATLLVTATTLDSVTLLWNTPPGVCSMPGVFSLFLSANMSDPSPPSTFVANISIPTTSTTVGDLEPAASYKFAIQVVTDYGVSPLSAATSVTTGSLPPDAPTIVVAMPEPAAYAVSGPYLPVTTSVVVNITLPLSDNGSPVVELGVVINGSEVVRVPTSSGPGDVVSVVVDELEPHQIVAVAAFASSVLGDSALSPTTVVTTLPGPPEAQPAPQAITSESTYTSVTAHWDGVATGSSRGLPIDHAVAVVAKSSTNFWAFPFPGRDYLVGFALGCLKPDGQGEYLYSSLSLAELSPVATTPPTVPDVASCATNVEVIAAPGNVSARAEVSFVQAAENGSPITVVEIELTPLSGSFGDTKLVAAVGIGAADTAVSVNDLDGATEYSLALRFGNAEGFAPFNNRSLCATVSSPPLAPRAPLAPLVSVVSSQVVAARAQALPSSQGSPITSVVLVATGTSGKALGTSVQVEVDAAQAVATTEHLGRLFGGEDYEVTAQARNAYGLSLSSPAEVVSLPPGEPWPIECTDGVVSDVTPSSFRAAWPPTAHNGGFPLGGYDVEIVAMATGTMVFSGTLTEPVYQLSGLDAGSQFNISVVPWNSAGSAAGCAMEAKTLALPPLPPTSVTTTVADLSAGRVLVTWAPAVERGAPVVEYLVHVEQGGVIAINETVSVMTNSEPALNITGLQRGVTYSLTVSAVSAAGISSPSNIWLFGVSPLAPQPLACPSVTQVGPKAVFVSWAAAVTNGAPVLVYRVEARVDAEATFIVRARVSTLNATLTDLVPGTVYSLRIVAESSVGPSSPSLCSSGAGLALPATAPEPTSDVDPPEIDGTTVVLRWSPARSNGEPVLEYLVQVSRNLQFDPSFNVSVTESRRRAPDARVELTTLAEETTYHARIAAINSLGMSPFSDVITFTTNKRSSTSSAQSPNSESGTTFLGLGSTLLFTVVLVIALLVILVLCCICCCKRSGDEQEGGASQSGMAAQSAAERGEARGVEDDDDDDDDDEDDEALRKAIRQAKKAKDSSRPPARAADDGFGDAVGDIELTGMDAGESAGPSGRRSAGGRGSRRHEPRAPAGFVENDDDDDDSAIEFSEDEARSDDGGALGPVSSGAAVAGAPTSGAFASFDAVFGAPAGAADPFSSHAFEAAFGNRAGDGDDSSVLDQSMARESMGNVSAMSPGSGDPWAAGVPVSNPASGATSPVFDAAFPAMSGGSGLEPPQRGDDDASSVFTVPLGAGSMVGGDDGSESMASSGDGGLFSKAFSSGPATRVEDESFNPFDGAADDETSALAGFGSPGLELTSIAPAVSPRWDSAHAEPVVVLPMVREQGTAVYTEGTLTQYSLGAEVAYGVPDASVEVASGASFAVVLGSTARHELLRVDGAELDELAQVGTGLPSGNARGIHRFGDGAWQVDVALAVPRSGGRPIFRLGTFSPDASFARVPLKAGLKYKLKQDSDGGAVLMAEVSVAVESFAPTQATLDLVISGARLTPERVASLKCKPPGNLTPLGEVTIALPLAEGQGFSGIEDLKLRATLKGSGASLLDLGGPHGVGALISAQPGVTVSDSEAFRALTFEASVDGRLL